ncbi:UDP-N-acetylmuramate dehydrogenase [Desulfonatronum thiosulfatophilum]|uniref:UDP-N-acetylenolpyruvoylglucosamine reductase n=1 Tax=Desulfonatronum thiosulfatophilum TaxID=617002 RepID=A0A1G6AN52_9BACT|nr:UDP-N-acetylmuramate dehydrogenase [Desulfonatronum thiosulfatophilum]SDB09824.1 UDP-N-acetylmuramate dehydrogenase [Desulfonatronum thiosulfatophilum]
MRILTDPVLAERTTLRLGGAAIAEIILEDERDLDGLQVQLASLGGEALVLGEGSNVLAKDGRLPLVLVRLVQPGEPEVLETGRDFALIQVPAALRLPRLLAWCRSRGFGGLEQWTGIPGSVGGAVAMNAGSYGVEMVHVLEQVRIWTPTQGCVWKEAADMEFGYRRFDSGMDDALQIVVAIRLRLGLSTPSMIRNRMQQWYGRKKQTQPVTMASAGCVFKNPAPEQPAGKLLDQAGLRGFELGKMAFSDKHANFLVNLGGGSASDAFELLDMARERVWKHFGVALATEVRIIP